MDGWNSASKVWKLYKLEQVLTVDGLLFLKGGMGAWPDG